MKGRLRGALVAAALLALPAGATYAQDTGGAGASSDAFSPLVDCANESRRLGVLVLLDMSQSLQRLDGDLGTDPRDERVRASQEAVDEVFGLGQSLSAAGRPVQIDIRFDGFGESYRPGRWTLLESDADLRAAKDEAETYRALDNEFFTNYSLALSEAQAALDEYDGECSLLLWFTDGRYDTDNDNSASAPIYGESEIAEIQGDALCGPSGPVEGLRKAERPLVVVGLGKASWSDSRRAREFALVKSIAEGVPFPPNAGLQSNFVCGSSDPLGVFEEVEDSSTLVEDLVGLLSDAIFEAAEDPSRDSEDESKYEFLCPASSETCQFDFVLGNYVRSFALYVNTPDTSSADFTLTSPSGAVKPIRDDRADVGLGISATRVGSWLWLEGVNPGASADWTGRWNVKISGYDERAPEVIAQIVPGVVAVEADPSYAVSLSDLRPSEGDEDESGAPRDLSLQLKLGDVPLVENAISQPLEPEVTMSVRIGDAEDIVDLVQQTDANSGESTRVIAGSDLADLALQADGWEWGLALEGEADFAVLESLKHRAPLDPAFIWFTAQSDVDVFGSGVIDREERGRMSSPPGIELGLVRNDVAVPQNPSFEVTIDAALTIGGVEVAQLDDLAMSADGRFEIPSEAIDEALAALDGSLLQIHVNPTVTHRATGTTRRADTALIGSVGIRADNGLPVLKNHEVKGVSEDDPDAPVVVSLNLEPPLQGVGSVKVIRILAQPALEGEYAGKTFELGGTDGCDDISSSDPDSVCEIQITHDFRAAIGEVSGLTIEYQLDGTDVKDGNRPDPQPLAIKPFPMERPPDAGTFWLTLALALIGFAAVQVLVRAIYTSVIAKWIPTPLGSRYAEIAIRITDSNDVVPADGGRLSVQPQDLKFASEFEKAKSHGQIGEQTFSIGWLKTFVGERRGLTFQQEPMVRVTAPGSFVIGPEGFDPPTSSVSVGVVPVGLARAWTIRIPTGARIDLANTSSVNGVLWFMLRPENEQPIDAQLDRLQQALESAGARVVGALRAAVATPIPEPKADTQPEAVSPRPEPAAPREQPDPFKSTSTDPFGGAPPIAPTNPADQSSPSQPPSSGFDPFA